MLARSSVTSLKISAAINVLLGAWLVWSPWEFDSYGGAAWNNWIVGAMILAFGAVRFFHPHGSRLLSLLNMDLGVWLILSPWVYGFAHEPSRLANSICVGILVLMFSASGFFDVARPRHGEYDPRWHNR
jgi:hypothetical protein